MLSQLLWVLRSHSQTAEAGKIPCAVFCQHRGSQHRFDWHGRQMKGVPLTGSSTESGLEAWDLGVEAVCCRCLPWGEAPRPRHGLAESPPMGRGVPRLPRGLFEGNGEFGHIQAQPGEPERIPRISPSTRASVIFLGIK